MSDYKRPLLISRRHFLRTSAGGLVAIPLLSSLLPFDVRAQMVAPKRFLGITMNNGFHPAFMFPEPSRIMTSQITANGLNAQVMPLSGLSGPISHIIGSGFDSLRNSMMVLRGFEALTPTLDHNGHFAFSGMSEKNLPAVGSRYPSIDQHIKNIVYSGNLPNLPILSISASWDNQRTSKSFTINPSTGAMVHTNNFYEPAGVWQQLFGSVLPTTTTGSSNESIKDKLVVDKVVEHYQSVVSNPKLSKDDKFKLESHLARVTDRQKTIMLPGPSVGCVSPSRPTVVFNQQSATLRQSIASFIDLIVAAFECDITRVVIFEIDPDVLWGSLDPHRVGYHGTSHGDTKAEIQAFSNISNEQFGFISSLWQKLQAAQDVDGKSIFYNTLSLVTKELGDYGSGVRTGNSAVDRIQYGGTILNPNMDNNHDGRGMFAMVGGHLGGILKPGRYIDYTSDIYSPNSRWKPLIGPSYAELLISTLAAFGVSPSAWEIGGKRGYGDNRESQWQTANPSICPKGTDQRSMLPGWT